MRADQYPLLVAIAAIFVIVPLLLWRARSRGIARERAWWRDNQVDIARELGGTLHDRPPRVGRYGTGLHGVVEVPITHPDGRVLRGELVAVPFTRGAITFRTRLDGWALRAETGGGPEGEDLLGDSTMTEHELAMLAQRFRAVGVWSVARLRGVDGAPYAMFANADSVAQLRDRLPRIAELLAQLER